jgi:hypothetical protein
VTITPDAQGRQHDSLLLTFHRALSPTGILFDLAGGHGQLEPQPIDQYNRRWGCQPGHFERCSPLLKSQYQAITGFKR